MRMQARTVTCPLCSRPAVLTLFDANAEDDLDEPRIEFSCTILSHVIDEAAKHVLWVRLHEQA